MDNLECSKCHYLYVDLLSAFLISPRVHTDRVYIFKPRDSSPLDNPDQIRIYDRVNIGGQLFER